MCNAMRSLIATASPTAWRCPTPTDISWSSSRRTTTSGKAPLRGCVCCAQDGGQPRSEGRPAAGLPLAWPKATEGRAMARVGVGFTPFEDRIEVFEQAAVLAERIGLNAVAVAE